MEHRSHRVTLASWVIAICLAAVSCGTSGRIDGINIIDAEATTELDVLESPNATASVEAPATVEAGGEPSGGVDDAVVAETLDVEAIPATVRPSMPTISPIQLPPIGDLSDIGEVVERRLGGLVTSEISGIEVISASCEAEGGELAYGDQGDDVFESDGSGQIVDDEDGLTTLTVEADGSGQFFSESDDRKDLLTIAVAPDGAGEYYNRRGSRLTTVRVGADGSGEYFFGPAEASSRDDEDANTTTISINPDGSGEYFSRRSGELLTVRVSAAGSGEYYFEGEQRIITVARGADGGWTMTDDAPGTLHELVVQPDGSGRYAVRDRNPLIVDFDVDGRGTYKGQLIQVDVPDTPQFFVDDRFPPLGKLGGLTPPCATVIRFESELLFDFGESTLRDDADSTLDQVVVALNEIGKPIEVNGHTDSKGSDERNLALSLDRANAVRDALESRGIAVDVEVNGFGESRPVAPNETADGEDDPAGRALNRRVEIVIRE